MIYETIINGINWVGLEPEDNEKIEKVAFKFGKEMIYPNQVMQRFGSKKRSSFEIEVPIRYIGRIKEEIGYLLLFLPVGNNVNYNTQHNLFEPVKYVYMAVISNDEHTIFLCQTSHNGFYDIKP